MNARPLRTTTVAALTAASLLTSTLPLARVQAQDEAAQTQTVTKGLAYLAKDGVQNPNGSWGGSGNPVAETSVGLMAFMLKGYVPGRGEYGRLMDKAISYLINKGRDQRGFLGTPNNHAGMYEHGLAVLALSEAWGQSKNPRLKTSLRRAVDIILRAQNAEGGWRYNGGRRSLHDCHAGGRSQFRAGGRHLRPRRHH